MTAAASLIAVAERHNPRRSFLLVSTVLGKHVPVDGVRCRAAGVALAYAVAGLDPAGHGAMVDALARGEVPADNPAALRDAVVLGFAETATGLAEQVAWGLEAARLQTTTRQLDALRAPQGFEEAHSHAPDQWIDAVPAGDGPLVIVDDELSTGATAANLIRTLHAQHARPRYVMAALVDARGTADGPLETLAAELGVPIDVVALERPTLPPHAAAGWSGGRLPIQAASELPPGAPERELAVGFDRPLQHQGQSRADQLALAAEARRIAADVGELPPGTLVLGTGEHLAFAQHFAVAAGALSSSSTRSPVLVSDRAGYPIAAGLAFANPDGPAIDGYAYNVRAAERPHVVVHFQDGAHRARGEALLAALRADGAAAITTITLAP